mgnify:CR=1 FL=1
MLKLFTVLFLDEPSERVKKCTRNYLSMPVRLLLAVPAGFLLLAGLLPDRILLPAAEQASAFFGAAGAVHGAGAPHWFSMENLSGAGISIGIGIFVYFTARRKREIPIPSRRAVLRRFLQKAPRPPQSLRGAGFC